jgi:hypothetical protein
MVRIDAKLLSGVELRIILIRYSFHIVPDSMVYILLFTSWSIFDFYV